MVERTAHNGLVAGSNPAKPKMTNKFKIYQVKKLKSYLKKTDLIFFVYQNNVGATNQLKLEQKLFKNNLRFYKIKNSLIKKVINQSVFLNYSVMFTGPLCIIHFKNLKNSNFNFQSLLNINTIVPSLTIKLNKKIYSNTQLKTLSTLNYSNNMLRLNKTFKRLMKISYYKFSNLKNYSK